MSKVIKTFKEVFTPEELKALENEVKLSEQMPEKKEEVKEEEKKEEVKMSEVTTKDGKVLSYEGELIVGTNVMEVVDGNATAATGTYELENGTMIEAQDGIVKMITPPVEAPMVAVEEMKTQLSAQKKDFEVQLSSIKAEMNKEVSALKESLKVALSTLNKILETPIEVKSEDNKTEIPYEQMTKHQQALYNRGKL